MALRHWLLSILFLAPAGLSALAAGGDVAGTVDIGGARAMYLECRGTGSPTVFIVPGGRAAADEWTKDSPVFANVAAFTRVCAYDRPGVLLSDGRAGRSDPLPMPTTAAASVADLHALVGARAPRAIVVGAVNGRDRACVGVIVRRCRLGRDIR